MTRVDEHKLSQRELAVLGMQDIAYVRRVDEEGISRYSVHAADGTPLGEMDSLDVAFAAVRQHGLEPVSVH